MLPKVIIVVAFIRDVDAVRMREELQSEGNIQEGRRADRMHLYVLLTGMYEDCCVEGEEGARYREHLQSPDYPKL